MKRRTTSARRTIEQLPPHLAKFNPDDWPEPGPGWPPEFGVRMYKRSKWNRARGVWLSEGIPDPRLAVKRRSTTDRPPFPAWALEDRDRHDEAGTWAIRHGYSVLEWLLAVGAHRRLARESINERSTP